MISSVNRVYSNVVFKATNTNSYNQTKIADIAKDKLRHASRYPCDSDASKYFNAATVLELQNLNTNILELREALKQPYTIGQG